MNMASALTLIFLILFASLMGVGYLYAERNRYEMMINQLTQEKLALEETLREVNARCQMQLTEALTTIEEDRAEVNLLSSQVAELQDQLSQSQAQLHVTLSESERLAGRIIWLEQELGTCSTPVSSATMSVEKQPAEMKQARLPLDLRLDRRLGINVLVALDIVAAFVLIYLLLPKISQTG